MADLRQLSYFFGCRYKPESIYGSSDAQGGTTKNSDITDLGHQKLIGYGLRDNRSGLVAKDFDVLP